MSAGHLAAMGCLQRHQTILRWAKECGPVFVLRLLWMRVVVVSDPVLVSQVLSRKADASKPAVFKLFDKVINLPLFLRIRHLADTSQTPRRHPA